MHQLRGQAAAGPTRAPGPAGGRPALDLLDQTADGRAYEQQRRQRAREADPEMIRAQTLASVRRVRAKAKGGTTSTTDGGKP